jgi:hypothetical protein
MIRAHQNVVTLSTLLPTGYLPAEPSFVQQYTATTNAYLS